MSDNNEIDQIEKKYGHLFVVAFCLALLLVVAIVAFASHWFNQRLLSDFWPVDKSSVAPNILASVIIFDVVTLTAALFYPPFKRALDLSLTMHKDDIKKHITAEIGAVHARSDEHDRMLKHIIEHSKGIPPLPDKDEL